MALNLPSLRHRDFRNYTLGRLVGNTGASVQQLAIAWQVYEISGQSSLHVGMLGLVRVVPLVLFSLVGGLAADHVDRRKLMVWTRLAMIVSTSLLLALTASGQITVTLVYTIVAFDAIARAFDGPARAAIMVNMVPQEDLPNALSVNGIAWRLSDVLGPVIIAAILVFGDVGWGYAFSVLAAVVLITVLLTMKPVAQAAPVTSVGSVREALWQIGDGFRFLKRSQVVRNTMVLDFWATFFSSADALFPAFAGPVLNLGPAGYGLLAGSSGVGALIAAVYLALRPTVDRQGALVIGMVGVYGLTTVLFGVSTSIWAAMFFLACTGAADMVSTVMRQTIRSLATPDEMRGRMGGVSVLFQVGGPQLGDAEAGVLAKQFGDRASVVIGGLACLGVAGIYALSGRLRSYRHADSRSQGT